MVCRISGDNKGSIELFMWMGPLYLTQGVYYSPPFTGLKPFVHRFVGIKIQTKGFK